MAALVQSFPQQSSTITMLQTRPASASGILQTSQGQINHQYAASSSKMHRNSYSGIQVNGSTTYRGQMSTAPVAPYAFTSTPSLTKTDGRASQGSYLQNDQRTASAPVLPTNHTSEVGQSVGRARYPATSSVSTTSSSSSSELSIGSQIGTQDDSAITSTARVATRARPQSTIIASAPASLHLSPTNMTSLPKTSPDRYRRTTHRRAETTGHMPNGLQLTPPSSSSSGVATVNHLYAQPSQAGSIYTGSGHSGTIPQIPPLRSFSANSFPTLYSNPTVDDMHLNRQATREEASRYRRRSIHTVDMSDFADAQLRSLGQHTFQPNSSLDGRQDYLKFLKNAPAVSNRPASSPGRSGNSETISFAHNNQPQQNPVSKREPSALSNPSVSGASDELSLKHGQPQLVNIPPRGSSTDAAKRTTNSSPLSKPMTMSPEPSVSKDSFASAVNAALQTPKTPYSQVLQGVRPTSPAAQQLAALSDRETKKSKTSRLRRAFSFGSAAELRRVSAENNAAREALATAERQKLRKDRYQDEQEAEQARIAQKQEEGGIGHGIYSGQGNVFSGSTDNLSISSTASSASIMIRKMGQGMKKSTRSLVGLFRPKSVIGVPAIDSTPSVPVPSQAQVSMVNVEAERDRININPSPHDRSGGGSGFPKLEKNSIDAVNVTVHERSGSSDNSTTRKTITGGEKDRAEVLAAVKKGILKRSGTDSGSSSPVVRPVDNKASNFNLPPIPHVDGSPGSSAPSTPSEDTQGHKRTGSVSIAGEDYFMSPMKVRDNTRSAPGTPTGPPGHPPLKRNATFSPRIQFHDTWPSGEYDRRGDIATCNRLTPMLAQQIKEELNSFKMEMEVHENSKIYTHFF